MYILLVSFHSFSRIELFDGKGGLVEGHIQNIDRTGVDFVAAEKAKLVSALAPQWHVFAAFGGSLRTPKAPVSMRNHSCHNVK